MTVAPAIAAPVGWHVAHTIGYDLYVFPPTVTHHTFTWDWEIDDAEGRTVAAGDETSLTGALHEATRAYTARVNPLTPHPTRFHAQERTT